MVELLGLLQPQIAALACFPREVAQLVLQYYSSGLTYVDDAHTLISIFTPGDDNYNKSLGAVLEHPDHFSHVSLFELALRHDQLVDGPWPTSTNQSAAASRFLSSVVQVVPESLEWRHAVSEEVLQLGLAGLASMARAEPSRWLSHSMEYIEWLVLRTSSGHTARQVTQSAEFSRLLEALCLHCQQQPEILLRALTVLERRGGAVLRSALINPVRRTLVTAFRASFLTLVSSSTSAGYSSIINKLVKAREHCRQHLRGNDGILLFDQEVLTTIRKTHTGKKKLQKMIKEEFGV